ncbi:MAG: hypothetical protein J6J83_04080 [Oscillospiraceae bacterium]|nr:hypothetical protein [Oscillospiraceae bacterium]
MTVEILYPELCNLYGDMGNMDYLRQCLAAEYHTTALGEEPWFVQHDVDLVFLCSMSERSQQRIIDALRPYRQRLAELMVQGKHFLLTGNAMEVFGKTITDGDEVIEGLGLLDVTARRIIPKRANSLFLGEFEGKKIVGYTSRFSHMESSLAPLFTVTKGLGRDENAAVEGVRAAGVLGTYLLGPLLVLNPDFTRWLLNELGAQDAPLAFEEEVRRAYEVRVQQFEGEIEL